MKAKAARAVKLKADEVAALDELARTVGCTRADVVRVALRFVYGRSVNDIADRPLKLVERDLGRLAVPVDRV